MSLLKMVQDQITPALMGMVAGKMNESESVVTKAIGGLMPTILSGMVQQAGSEKGLAGLFGILSKPETAGYLDNLGGLIGGGNLAHGDPRDVAGNLMGQMFGDKIGPILAAIASFAGLKNKDHAGGLLGLAGPLVMGVLSKKIMKDGLNAAGLVKLLMGEKDKIHAAVPAGVASLIGVPAVTAAAPTPSAYDDDKRGGAGWLLWLIPLLLLIGLGWYLLGGNSDRTMTTVTPAPEVEVAETLETPEAVVEETVVTAPAASEMGFDMSLLTENGVETRLVDFINSDTAPCTDAACWFTLDRVTFETGSANIDMTQSSDQLGNIKRIMDAYPSLQLKFGGYTDNTGSVETNIALSQRRAEAVVSALVGMGVDAARMGAEGYGPEFPVASNDTEEGRAQNRRIDVRVRER